MHMDKYSIHWDITCIVQYISPGVSNCGLGIVSLIT